MCEMSCTGIRGDVTISRELLLACRDSAEGDFPTSVPLLRLREGQKPRGSQSNYCSRNLKRSCFSYAAFKSVSWKSNKNEWISEIISWGNTGLNPLLRPSFAGSNPRAVGISTCHVRVNWINRSVIVPWWLTAPELLCENPHAPLLHCLATI